MPKSRECHCCGERTPTCRNHSISTSQYDSAERPICKRCVDLGVVSVLAYPNNSNANIGITKMLGKIARMIKSQPR